MTVTTASVTSPWLPEHVDRLVIQPALAASVAAQVATVIRPAASSNTFSVPLVTTDPAASWTAEGDPITPADAVLSSTTSAYYKLAALSKIANEAVDDADPALLAVTGAGMVRDIARKVDVAFFGDLGDAKTPDGLESLTTATDVDAASYANLDPFAKAIADAEQVGATINSFVTDPATALALAQLKDQSGSLRPLLGVDPTAPTRRSILGVPLYVSSAVTAGVVWGVPRDRTFVAMRRDATIEVSADAYFGDDVTGIRCITRVAFAFAHPAALVRISDDGS